MKTIKIPKGDGAFDLAWKKLCPTCPKGEKALILFFREKCHKCEQNKETMTGSCCPCG